jgi:hypothetical protein
MSIFMAGTMTQRSYIESLIFLREIRFPEVHGSDEKLGMIILGIKDREKSCL